MMKGKRLSEDAYSHRRTLEREKKKERMRLMVVKGLEKAVKEVNPSRFLSGPVFVSVVDGFS